MIVVILSETFALTDFSEDVVTLFKMCVNAENFSQDLISIQIVLYRCL